MGCFSDGGVHSHLDHLYALLELAAPRRTRPPPGVRARLHRRARYRSTRGHQLSCTSFSRRPEQARAWDASSLSSGRYYAMDRDERWERIERAYQLLTKNEGTAFKNPMDALQVQLQRRHHRRVCRALATSHTAIAHAPTSQMAMPSSSTTFAATAPGRSHAPLPKTTSPASTAARSLISTTSSSRPTTRRLTCRWLFLS